MILLDELRKSRSCRRPTTHSDIGAHQAFSCVGWHIRESGVTRPGDGMVAMRRVVDAASFLRTCEEVLRVASGHRVKW